MWQLSHCLIKVPLQNSFKSDKEEELPNKPLSFLGLWIICLQLTRVGTKNHKWVYTRLQTLGEDYSLMLKCE